VPHRSNWFPITFAVWFCGNASTNRITLIAKALVLFLNSSAFMEAAYDIFNQSSTLRLQISDFGLRILNRSTSSKRLFNPQSAI